MDIEKLIEAVKLCGSTPKVDQCKQCTYWAGGDMSKCIPRMTLDAATALSTLQAENDSPRSRPKTRSCGQRLNHSKKGIVLVALYRRSRQSKSET